MHVTLVLVKGRSNRANKQDTPQRPDSTQCNVSLPMIKDVTPKINDSLVQTNALHLMYDDCPS